MAALCLLFEFKGGIANVNDAPPADYMGFFCRANCWPIYSLRQSLDFFKKAQMFTFAHEYAHALAGEDGISNPFRAKNSLERSCNVFAAEFLAPMDAFAELVEGFRKTDRSDTASFVNATASRSLLSKHAAAIRLFEGNYISQRAFQAWRSVFTAAPKAEKEEEKEATPSAGGGAPHAKRIGELDYLPIVLAKRAIDRKMIDNFDVADGIGLSPKLQERAFMLATRRFEVATS